MFLAPELEMKALILAVDAEKDLQEEDIKSADKHILWSINYDRFNREFRDQVRILNAQAIFNRWDFERGHYSVKSLDLSPLALISVVELFTKTRLANTKGLKVYWTKKLEFV
jgi:hypothetical protein